jgi:flavin-dependent dehydrogenase
MQKLAREAEVSMHRPRELRVSGADEKGVTVELDGGAEVRPKLLILAGELPPEQKRILGLLPAWDAEVMHRYTYLRLKGGKWHAPAAKPVVPMSLDILGTLNWAWMLPGNGQVQIAVDQPSQSVGQHSPAALLTKWVDVLVGHGMLHTGGAGLEMSQAVSLDLPLGGALSQEGVANRTLLIGPAGGFYTACAEDIYPNCWSAIHAVEVAAQAVKERHLQDALQPYRQRWGATLGDYLRGPQQNLRFLLPLVYRNATMTARLAEAILWGKSVVR